MTNSAQRATETQNLNIFIWKFNPFWIARFECLIILPLLSVSFCVFRVALFFLFSSFQSKCWELLISRSSGLHIFCVCISLFLPRTLATLLLPHLNASPNTLDHFFVVVCSLFLLAVILFWFYNKIHINLKLIICGINNLFSVRNFAPWCVCVCIYYFVKILSSPSLSLPSLCLLRLRFISFEMRCLFSWSYDRRELTLLKFIASFESHLYFYHFVIWYLHKIEFK